MWGTAFERYGRDFLRTFYRHWPESVDLAVVTDKPLPIYRGRQIMLGCTGYRDFLERWGEDRRARGYNSGFRKVEQDGYSWRFDAVKWAPQAFAPRAALYGLSDGDILVWLDADVETHSDVPEGWIDSLLGGRDVACLQRSSHSEIGFWAMRLNERTRAIIGRFAAFYETGEVFGMGEYHSAYVWDRALETETVSVADLNTSNVRGHPWPQTRLAEHTTHKKGKQKPL